MAERSGNNKADYKEKQKWIVQYQSSLQFKNQLKQMQEPKIDLECKEEIDNLFDNYTKEYQIKLNDNVNYVKRREGRIDFRQKNTKADIRKTLQTNQQKKLDDIVKEYEESLQKQNSNQSVQSPLKNKNLKSKKNFQISKQASSIFKTSGIKSPMKKNNNLRMNTISDFNQKSVSENDSEDIDDNNLSIDSQKLEQIRDMVERLQFKSYANFKKFQEEKKKVIKYTEEDKEREKKITKGQIWQQSQDQIQSQFNKVNGENIKMNLDVENQSTDILGNHLVTTLFKAMLVKQIRDNFGLNYNIESGLPISDKLIEIFGINMNFLRHLKNESERRDYIIKTMESRIDILMKDWNNEIQTREKKYQKEEQNQQKIKEKIEEEEEDQFMWFQLKTKHNNLRKKLKTIIIQKMNEYENNTKLIAKYKNNKKQLTQHEINQLGTVMLSGVPQIKTKNLISQMNEKEGEILKKLQTKKQQQDQQQQIDQENNLKKTYLNDFQQEKNEENQKTFEWDQKLEKQYLDNKKKAKNLYSKDIDSSNWTELGYLPLVQKYNLDNRNNFQREVILDKYVNRDFVHPQELKFIADTSKLLNSCLDKKFLQNSLQIIDPESLNQLELNLAENIISNYQQMKNTIKMARTKYVYERKQKTQQQNIEQVKKWKKIKEIQDWKDYHKKKAKLINKEVERVQRTRPILFAYQENIFFRIFVNIIKEKLKKIRRRKEIEEKHFKEQGLIVDQQLSKIEKMMEMTKKEKRDRQIEIMKNLSYSTVIEEKNKIIKQKIHKLHPPSKIPYFPQTDDSMEEEREIEQKKERKNQMEKKIQQFKLGTKSHSDARIQENFSNYYSNGPIKPKPSLRPYDKDYKPLTKEEQQKVEMLGNKIRQYKMRNIVTDLKNKTYNNQIKEYQQKLNTLHNGKYLKYATDKFMIINKKNLSKSNKKTSQSELQFTQYQEHPSIEIEEANERIQQLELKLNKINMSHQSISTNQNERFATHESQDKTEDRYFHNQYLLTDKNASVSRFDIQNSIEKRVNTENISLPNKNQVSFNSPQKQSAKKNRPMTSKLDKQLQQIMKNTEKDQFKKTIVKNQENYGKAGFLMSQLKQKHQYLLNAARRSQFQHILYGKYDYKKEDFKQLDNNNCAAIYYTVLNNDLEFTKWILQQGGDPNIISKFDNSPLHLAFKIDNFDLINILLEYGADLNTLNAQGYTPPGLAQVKTLKRLGLENCVVQSKTKDRYRSEDEFFDNNKLLIQEKVIESNEGKQLEYEIDMFNDKQQNLMYIDNDQEQFLDEYS